MIKIELLDKLIQFRKERDWEQFHSAKELAISLSIEASELLEWFQWRQEEEILNQLGNSDKREQLEDEIADVAIYLSYLCHDVGIDLNAAVEAKIEKNAKKYPLEKVKGRADKYSDYD
jgi:NTP pyrophosphatase (non-canonical NTP hydrolase)